MTIPHRMLGCGYHIALCYLGFRVHPPGSRAGSRGERVCGQFPRVDSKGETPSLHHGTRVLLEKSKVPSHPERIQTPRASPFRDGLRRKGLERAYMSGSSLGQGQSSST